MTILAVASDADRHKERLREVCMDYPNEVSLETLTKCNASCKFCPYPTLSRIGNKMSDELIDRLIKEMASWQRPFWFAPFKLSEALLDKRLYPILKRMNKEVPLALIRIFTNGAPLTWDNAEKLHDINNLVLNISLNEVDKAKHEELMGIRYDQVIRNIDELHASDFRHPVTVQRVGYDKDFQEFCEDRWPRFANAMIKMEGWLGYLPGHDSVPDTFCARWFELNITSEGRCVLCCMADGSKEEHYIGDLNKQTMLEVYNSPVWRERREKMLSRREVPVCNTCSY